LNKSFVIWSLPVYVLNIPSQLKKFIELIHEKNAQTIFKDKFTAVITTSIHFFDNLAQNYMEAIINDLDMRYLGGYSPDMYDLRDEDKRKTVLQFFESAFEAIQANFKPAKSYNKLINFDFVYKNSKIENTINNNKKVLIICDNRKDSNISNMAKQLKNSFTSNVELINIEDLDIKGPCLGCCECGFDYECVYTGKDGFIDFYLDKMKSADIIFFAGTIKDRHLSSTLKKFIDRSFFHTHTPTLTDKQIGFLIEGNYTYLDNVKEFIKGFTQWQRANLVGVISDESMDSTTINYQIENIAKCSVDKSNKGFVAPWSFLGIGGHKIFRDDIWGRMRFVFQADHKYYEANGFYDFPQEEKDYIELNKKMMDLTANPEMRIKIRKMIKDQMVAPFKHIAETK